MEDNNFTNVTNIEKLLEELKNRPERPIPVLCEDTATLEGLIDLLVIKNIILEDELLKYINRYQSVITAIVMLLIEKDIILDKEIESAISSYHFALRHCRPDATSDEIFNTRRSHLSFLLEKL